MPGKLQLTVNVSVTRGPTFNISDTIDLQGYGVIPEKKVPGIKPPEDDQDSVDTGSRAVDSGTIDTENGDTENGDTNTGNSDSQPSPQNDGGPVEISLHLDAAEPVEFLLIMSDVYDSRLSYSVNAKEPNTAKRHQLDSAHVLPGRGAVGLLGASPQSLFFYNESEQDATISILVGFPPTN